MKRRLTILCQVISLIYVAICLIALLKTHNRSPRDYARYRIDHTETIQTSVDRVKAGGSLIHGIFRR